jgi:hypothetical protein
MPAMTTASAPRHPKDMTTAIKRATIMATSLQKAKPHRYPRPLKAKLHRYPRPLRAKPHPPKPHPQKPHRHPQPLKKPQSRPNAEAT